MPVSNIFYLQVAHQIVGYLKAKESAKKERYSAEDFELRSLADHYMFEMRKFELLRGIYSRFVSFMFPILVSFFTLSCGAAPRRLLLTVARQMLCVFL